MHSRGKSRKVSGMRGKRVTSKRGNKKRVSSKRGKRVSSKRGRKKRGTRKKLKNNIMGGYYQTITNNTRMCGCCRKNIGPHDPYKYNDGPCKDSYLIWRHASCVSTK